MPNSIQTQTKRSSLWNQPLQCCNGSPFSTHCRRWGRFGGGTVSINYRRCGKPTCHCAQPGEHGHGPQYLWNATIGGKSYAKNLTTDAEVEKYAAETERYRQFVQLCERLVQVNERLCEEHPVRETPSVAEVKKTVEGCQEALAKEITQVVALWESDMRRFRHCDVEALETQIPWSAHQVGRVFLEQLLNGDGTGYERSSIPCSVYNS